jgi:hypothetical protein
MNEISSATSLAEFRTAAEILYIVHLLLTDCSLKMHGELRLNSISVRRRKNTELQLIVYLVDGKSG